MVKRILRLDLMGPVQGNNEHILRHTMLNVEPDNDSIGIIFGNTTTTQFKFAITAMGVKRTAYIQVWHDDHKWVLGQIMELNLESNMTYSKAQEISHEHMISSLGLGDNSFKTKNPVIDNADNGKLTGMVNIVGYRDRHGIVQLPSSPFKAGQPVYLANENLITSVLGLDVDKKLGTYIGLLRNHDLKVYLDINSLVQKHISVIAKTGSGKSYMVGVLIEELIKRKVPVIIIDPHGEYSSIIHPNIDEHDTRLMSKFNVHPRGYPDAVLEFSLNPSVNIGTIPLKLSSYGFSPEGIGELLGLKGSGVQAVILYKALNLLMAKRDYFTLRELSAVIEHDRNNAKWHLINSLENLQSTGIFSDTPTRLTDLAQPGRATIVNLRGTPPQQQQIVVTQLLRQLFEARKLNKIPALMLVVEEAHQFCPQQGRARSSNIIKTIASEGRKFGLGLCVVSQRPAMVDKNVLSQCNTQVILKVTNPNDLKAIIASMEGLTTAMVDEIQRLPVSVGIVVGGGIQVPIFVDVRVRETKHGGRPVDIFSNVETFQADQLAQDEDLSVDYQEQYDDYIDQANEEPEKIYGELSEKDVDDDKFDDRIDEIDEVSASEEFVNIKGSKKYLGVFKTDEYEHRKNVFDKYYGSNDTTEPDSQESESKLKKIRSRTFDDDNDDDYNFDYLHDD